MTRDLGAELRSALSGSYRIERELGQGGMATVYLAHDLRHDRRVALKVLRPELAAVIGPARFLVEIKTTANLQHPHILPLHDSGEVNGTAYYVMPYVEGESLRDRLNREKQLPVSEALRIATEVADALDYAHRGHVIHRDIKPENILLHGGHALVADFGIALAAIRSDGARLTETGLSLGTPHYMSPEQAMGERDITGKTDIYALGCVLYEMLAAEPPFTGGTVQAIVARVLTEEPRSLSAVRRTVPGHVEAAVRTALAKLPADRFATAGAFAAALADSGYSADSGPVAGTRTGRSPEIPGLRWIAGGVAAAAAVLGGVLIGRRMAPVRDEAPIRFAVEAPDSTLSITRCCGRAQALSPDGSTLAFVVVRPGRTGIYRRRVDQLGSEMIAGTEDGAIPFFSPDGQWLGFAAGGALRKVPVAGGTPATIVTAQLVTGASWGDRGEIVFSMNSRLWTVPASGGTPRQVTSPDSLTRHVMPAFLPGGTRALFTIRPARSPVENSRIGIVDIATGHIDTLAVGLRAEYTSGYLVFSTADHSVMAQPFDPARGRATGSAIAVATHVLMSGSITHEFSATPDWLSYQPGPGQGTEVLRIAGPGVPRAVGLDGRAISDLDSPSISPDGQRVLLDLVPQGGRQRELWMLDLRSGSLSRFTSAFGRAPVWSRDGKRIAFSVLGDSSMTPGIYVSAPDQGGPPQLLLAGDNLYPATWLADGRSLVFAAVQRSRTRNDIGMIVEGDSTPRWLAAAPSNESTPQVSPDGRWLAFASDRTGLSEVYLQPMAGSAPTPVQVSVDGGRSPRWSADGHTLYYFSRGSLVAATLAPGSGVMVANRKPFVAMPGADLNDELVNWDLFPNGRDVLYVDGGNTQALSIVLIRNWRELIRRAGGSQQP